MSTEYCKIASAIVSRYGDTVVKLGVPTTLYWHLSFCEECRDLRESCLQEEKMTVIEFVIEEVRRQGFDVKVPSGIKRVTQMLEAWNYAFSLALYGVPFQKQRPRIGDVVAMAKMIEPEDNKNGTRWVPVRGDNIGFKIFPRPEEIMPRMERLFDHGQSLAPVEFYKELMEIHPFKDGNGRVGKIVFNWLNNTLLNPVFPKVDWKEIV